MSTPSPPPGPRKRKAPLDANGEPVNISTTKKSKSATSKVSKNKAAPAAPKTSVSTKSARVRPHSSSVEIEEVEDEDIHPKSKPPRDSRRIIESSEDEDDGSGSESSDGIVEIEAPGESAEAELKRMSAKWTSPVYVFFRPTPRIEYVDGRRSHVFECAAGQCRARNGRDVRRFLDKGDGNSTGNLNRHAKCCWGDEAVEAAAATRDLAGAREVMEKSKLRDGTITSEFARIGKGKVTFSHRQHTKTEARAEIVRWVAESKCPFKIVKDRGFISLMKTGRPEYSIPSPETVSRDVKKVFLRVRQRIAKLLQEHEGTLSFATDAWTSPNDKAFVAVMVHFEQKGVPISMLLDLVELAVSHTGHNLAVTVAKIFQDFGISDKVLSMTSDNASNNDVMVEELADLVENFPGAANQTRCFTHILNLVVKSILYQFDVPKAKANVAVDAATRELLTLGKDIEIEERIFQLDNEEDDEEEDDNVEGWINEQEKMSGVELDELSASVRPVRFALTKLRKLAFAIKHSSTVILPEWYNTLKVLILNERKMPRDVRTRWNSTFDMIIFALEYRAAIDALTANRDMKLREYEMSQEEWEIIAHLQDVLKIFKDATLFFSRANANVATVIPAMDHIDAHLATEATNTTYPVSIQAALAVGKRTLNRYYNKTDHSEVYRIAMVLHPRHKLEYFQHAGWESAWIDTAKDIVRAEFDRSYAFRDVPVQSSKAHADGARKPVASASKNMFDSLPTLGKSQAREVRDELDRYLGTDTEDVSDVLLWWYERKHLYPRLSRMALDYLTIPPTSTCVERIFSQGRIVLSHVRNRLSVQSTRALMCVGVWSLLGLVHDKDVLAAALLPAVEGEEEALAENWDTII